MVITTPLIILVLVMVGGLLLYLPSITPKINRIGEIMFGCALLVLLALLTRVLL